MRGGERERKRKEWRESLRRKRQRALAEWTEEIDKEKKRRKGR